MRVTSLGKERELENTVAELRVKLEKLTDDLESTRREASEAKKLASREQNRALQIETQLLDSQRKFRREVDHTKRIGGEYI